MASVGAHLRQLREARGVPLDEISRRTRIPVRYLEALEVDRFDALPARVFARGFVRAYCEAVGEPPEEALALFDGVRPPSMPVRQARTAGTDASTRTSRGRGAVLVSFVLLVVLGGALFTVTLLVNPRPVSMPEPVPPPAAPSPARAPDAPPATPADRGGPGSSAPDAPASGPAPSSSPATPSPAPRETSPVAPPSSPTQESASAAARPADAGGRATSPYRLVARASEPTWIRIRTADGRTQEETVPAGEVREWVSNEPFVLTVGNAGGVRLELNGRPLPALGASGTVIPRLVLPPP